MHLTVFGVNGPYPAPGGALSGYLVSSEDFSVNVLLDCGSGVLARLSDWPTLRKISAVVLSHLHFDHMSDMLPMRYALEFQNLRMPVYAPKTPEPQAALLAGGPFELRLIQDVSIGPLRVAFQPARHPVEAYSIAIEEDGRRFVYTGDTNTNPALIPFARDADMLLADAGLLERDWKTESPHLSALKCGELSVKAGVRKLVLTHLSPKYEPLEILAEARIAYPQAVLARPGETLRV